MLKAYILDHACKMRDLRNRLEYVKSAKLLPSGQTVEFPRRQFNDACSFSNYASEADLVRRYTNIVPSRGRPQLPITSAGRYTPSRSINRTVLALFALTDFESCTD
jgi:hypothetical protein